VVPKQVLLLPKLKMLSLFQLPKGPFSSRSFVYFTNQRLVVFHSCSPKAGAVWLLVHSARLLFASRRPVCAPLLRAVPRNLRHLRLSIAANGVINWRS